MCACVCACLFVYVLANEDNNYSCQKVFEKTRWVFVILPSGRKISIVVKKYSVVVASKSKSSAWK